ncbi:hypothetical protein D477_003933 [Arthrobacter crystallopoietes BAB-32]|uniref:Uncharacterized protein n=1 Tax=Arthrobacter crystallopoietes BAB-32 TaxID=1246476 RepID=N1UYP7_9MICC|nr:hypothetical protein [Arthrobacter crystallopoietes]EMY35516.1 hypothetical protein D477_003933 [Arthrobacter crystallopoietes BAB-32]
MEFFGAARQARRDDKELGKGIWRRTHDRFKRGLDRYHQVLEGVADDALYDQLVGIANELSAQLTQVRGCCMRAQQLRPSDGLDIPGGKLAAVHRSLSKAGNSLAAAAESAAMARLAASPEASQDAAESVRRRAAIVVDDVTEALRLLEGDEA